MAVLHDAVAAEVVADHTVRITFDDGEVERNWFHRVLLSLPEMPHIGSTCGRQVCMGPVG